MKIVSVIMPYFKKKKFFKKSYYSVLKQKIKNIEIVIIYDDIDLSDLVYLKKIINNRKNTKLIQNKKNYGVAISRNIGIKNSVGKYLAFLDCDDIWSKNKLFEQIQYMNINNLDFTHTSYKVISEKGKYLYNFNVEPLLSYKELLKSCDIGLSTVVIRSRILNSFRFKKIKTKEDYLLWLELSKKGYKITGINKYLTAWRKVKNSLSSDMLQKIKDSFRIYYFYEKQNLLKAILSVFVLSFFALKKKCKY